MKRTCLLLSVLLCGCKKPIVDAQWAQFSAPIGSQLWPACTLENDGKRFRLRGYVRPRQTTEVGGKTVRMDLHEAPQGEGRSIDLELVEGKHVSFETAEMKAKWSGGAMGKEGKLVGVTLHTANGDADLDQQVAVVVELKVVPKFQSKEIGTCQLFVDELAK